MRKKFLMSAVLALCSLAFAGCNAINKSPDGSISIDQPTLAQDLSLVRGVIAVESPSLLADFDKAATIGQVAAILASAPPAVQAKVPAATKARIKKAATQPTQ